MTPWTDSVQRRGAPVRCLKYLRSWCTRKRSNKSKATSVAPMHETPVSNSLERGVAAAWNGGVVRNRLRHTGRRTLDHCTHRTGFDGRDFRHARDNEDTLGHLGGCRRLLRVIPALAIPPGLQLRVC